MPNSGLPPHTLRGFDHDMNRIRDLIRDCGTLATRQTNDAVAALIGRDSATAGAIEAIDEQIDELQAAIEMEALNTISRRSPQADDLREVLAAIKIAGDLERVGDYAKNIAKRTIAIAQIDPVDLETQVAPIARQVTEMVDDAITAYIERDGDLARDVIHRDAAVNAAYNAIFSSFLKYMDESSARNAYGAHLLFIAKNLERIGDHATNIAELAYFSATGDLIGHRANAGDAYEAVVRKSD